MMIQQISLYLVASSYSIRNYPFAMQLLYFVSAYIYSMNRAKVVVFRFKKSLWPITIEPKSHPEYLPRNFVFSLISVTCLIVLGVAYIDTGRLIDHMA